MVQFQYTLMETPGEGFVIVLQLLDILTHVTVLESDFDIAISLFRVLRNNL